MKKYKSLFLNSYLVSGYRWKRVLDESVIHVRNYLNILKILLDNEKRELLDIKKFEDKINFLNKLFKSYKITFKVVDEPDYGYGIVRGNCYKDEITIYFNEEVIESLLDSTIFNLFKKELFPLIGHELVHRGQYFIRQGDFLNFLTFEKDDIKKYTNNQEIMAYAYMAIENMRYSGFSDDEILQKLQNKNISHMESGIIRLYISDIKEKDEKSYKKFIKYVVSYLKDPIKYELKVNF